MVNKSIIIALMFGILILGSLGIISAYDWVNDSHPRTLDGSQLQTGKGGIYFSTNYSINISNITKTAYGGDEGSTKCYVAWANATTIASGDFIGTNCDINPDVTLTAGTYLLATDKAGAEYKARANGAVFPYDGININFTKGYINGVNDSGFIQAVMGAWTLNISEAPASGNVSVYLSTPLNNSVNSPIFANLTANVSSTIGSANTNFTNITFYLWNTSGLANYSTVNISGDVYNKTTVNFTNLNSLMRYYWNVEAYYKNATGNYIATGMYNYTFVTYITLNVLYSNGNHVSNFNLDCPTKSVITYITTRVSL